MLKSLRHGVSDSKCVFLGTERRFKKVETILISEAVQRSANECKSIYIRNIRLVSIEYARADFSHILSLLWPRNHCLYQATHWSRLHMINYM